MALEKQGQLFPWGGEEGWAEKQRSYSQRSTLLGRESHSINIDCSRYYNYSSEVEGMVNIGWMTYWERERLPKSSWRRTGVEGIWVWPAKSGEGLKHL